MTNPIDLAMRFLKDEKPDPQNWRSEGYPSDTQLHELGLADLARLESHPNPRIRHKALKEQEMRAMETEGAMPYDWKQPAKDLADFYGPQFTNLDEQTLGGDLPPFHSDEYRHHELAGDVEEQMPGQTFFLPNVREKFDHLKEVAPPHIAEDYAQRMNEFYEDMTSSKESPILGKIPAQYQQPYPTPKTQEDVMDEIGRITEATHTYPGGPVEATGFSHGWQEKNASEPMDLAFRLLKRQMSLGDFDDSSGLMQTTPENPRHRKWAKRGGTTKLPIKITDPHNLYLTYDRGMYRLVHPEHGPVSSVMTGGSSDPDFDVVPPQPGRRRLGSDKKPSTVYIEQGTTYPQFQRQGMYEKLLNSVINALPENASLMSHARNEMSGPFHMKYSKNLPRGVTMSEPMDKQGRDLWATRMEELADEYEGIGEPVPDSHRTMRFAPLAYTRDLSQPEFGSLRPMVEGAVWMPPNVARGRLSPNVRPSWESKSQQTQFEPKTGQAKGYESKYGRFLPMPWGDVAVKIPQNMPGVTRPLPMSALIDMKLRQSAFDVGNLAAAWPRLWPQPTAQPAYNAVMGTSTDPNPSAAERFEF